MLAEKAERLLVHERALLYWPLFRAGVLPPPYQDFFASHRSALEAIADAFWLAVLALALMGCALCYRRRQWLALSLLPQAAVLVVLYTTIFSEPRYRLPVFMLVLPLAAIALEWLWQTSRSLMCRTMPTAWKREVALVVGFAALVFAAAPALAWAGGRLREHHRWAVDECVVAGRPQFCKWRMLGSAGNLDGRTGLRGVWNGVGIAMASAAPYAAVETEMLLAPGDYALSAALDLAPVDGAHANGTVMLLGNGQPLLPAISLADIARRSSGGQTVAWSATCRHADGPLRFRMQVEVSSPPGLVTSAHVWLSDLRVTPVVAP